MPLEKTHRWFQGAVVDPGEIRGADAVVLPSPTLTAAERVAIYKGMYPLRMNDALATDYPALQHFLGAERFRTFAWEYVQAYPSRSYTLNRLGDHVPEFISSDPRLPRREFCHDLARLELAITEVFDAEEVEPLASQDVEAIAPEAWPAVTLVAVPAFRLLELRYLVNDYLQSVKEDNHDHPKARRKPNWVAIHRRNLALYRLDLSRRAHGLLADLVAGKPLGEAIEAALTSPGRGKPSAEDLFRWFREWVAGGIFRRIEVPSG